MARALPPRHLHGRVAASTPYRSSAAESQRIRGPAIPYGGATGYTCVWQSPPGFDPSFLREQETGERSWRLAHLYELYGYAYGRRVLVPQRHHRQRLRFVRLQAGAATAATLRRRHGLCLPRRLPRRLPLHLAGRRSGGLGWRVLVHQAPDGGGRALVRCEVRQVLGHSVLQWNSGIWYAVGGAGAYQKQRVRTAGGYRRCIHCAPPVPWQTSPRTPCPPPPRCRQAAGTRAPGSSPAGWAAGNGEQAASTSGASVHRVLQPPASSGAGGWFRACIEIQVH